MRIIAGAYRSRPLKSLPGMDLRPTSDRLRETLFNVLAAASTLEGSVWLDLFAGTGAVGIEALSRGARQVYFVESERKHARLLRENLNSLKITEGFDVYESEVASALRVAGCLGRDVRLLLSRSAVPACAERTSARWSFLASRGWWGRRRS